MSPWSNYYAFKKVISSLVQRGVSLFLSCFSWTARAIRCYMGNFQKSSNPSSQFPANVSGILNYLPHFIKQEKQNPVLSYLLNISDHKNW